MPGSVDDGRIKVFTLKPRPQLRKGFSGENVINDDDHFVLQHHVHRGDLSFQPTEKAHEKPPLYRRILVSKRL